MIVVYFLIINIINLVIVTIQLLRLFAMAYLLYVSFYYICHAFSVLYISNRHYFYIHRHYLKKVFQMIPYLRVYTYKLMDLVNKENIESCESYIFGTTSYHIIYETL